MGELPLRRDEGHVLDHAEMAETAVFDDLHLDFLDHFTDIGKALEDAGQSIVVLGGGNCLLNGGAVGRPGPADSVALLDVVSFLRNIQPTSGKRPNNGTRVRVTPSSCSYIPPIATVSPLSSNTLVLICFLLIRSEAPTKLS